MRKYVSLLLLVIGFQYLSAGEPTGRYKVIVDKMNALQAQYPQTTHIFSIGTNDDGVEIYAMRISTAPTEMDSKKIGQILVSTHHGNELKAPEFTMYFLTELIKRYHSKALFREKLADMEWTVIPVLNISGYNANNRYEKGMDPNRDYPGPCISSQGGKIKSIQRLMDFLKTRPFAGSLTVHGYAGALTYPWGISVGNTHTNDHNAFEQITSKAAALSGYRYGTSTDVVYPCDGAYEDYTYWKYGIWSLLLELKDGSDSDIKMTNDSIKYYFDQIDSTPSLQNQLTSSCARGGKPDLRNE